MYLPPGAELFVYSSDHSRVVRFTDADNKSHKQLWTPVFESEQVVVEINLPEAMKEYLTFNLKSVNQGYRSIKPGVVAKSGSCNIDVVCPEADSWRDELRSVARYSINTPNGSGLCTGSLINNLEGDSKPYFLTAEHCGVSPSSSPTMVFYWNYETSVCGGQPDGQLNMFQTGATFRAAHSDSDFALVELDSNPVADNAYWAGWSRATEAPTSVVGIHHPSGDEKRISFENDPLTITFSSSNIENSNGQYLRVGAWDLGTTEPGSSGSGIWNASRQIVGTLTGGRASCDEPTEPDWYGRFASHWDLNASSSEQLKVWLDPMNTGAVDVSGSEGCNAPSATISISPNPANINDTVSFSVAATGGSGSYTYNWDLNGDGQSDSTEATTTRSFSAAFQGNVRVVVTDSSQCSAAFQSALVINDPSDSGGDSGESRSSGGGGSLGFILLGFLFVMRQIKK